MEESRRLAGRESRQDMGGDLLPLRFFLVPKALCVIGVAAEAISFFAQMKTWG